MILKHKKKDGDAANISSYLSIMSLSDKVLSDYIKTANKEISSLLAVFFKIE